MPDLRREFRTVVAGAEQPDRRQRRLVGHRHHIVVGVAGRKIAGLPQDQFLQPLEKIVALAAVEPAAQRVRGGAVGARRAAEAQIDPAGKQRLQHLEPLGHHQRRVVGQHHPAGADPDMAGHRGDLPDHQVGRGARDRGQIVMFGQPVADIAQRIGVARQIDAVAQGHGRLGPVVTTERSRIESGIMRANLVRRTGPHKGCPDADQARVSGPPVTSPNRIGGTKSIYHVINRCPHCPLAWSQVFCHNYDKYQL